MNKLIVFIVSIFLIYVKQIGVMDKKIIQIKNIWNLLCYDKPPNLTRQHCLPNK